MKILTKVVLHVLIDLKLILINYDYYKLNKGL